MEVISGAAEKGGRGHDGSEGGRERAPFQDSFPLNSASSDPRSTRYEETAPKKAGSFVRRAFCFFPLLITILRQHTSQKFVLVL